MDSKPPTYLKAGEVRAILAKSVGGSGEYTFRKWTTGEKPVLKKILLPTRVQPVYALEDVLQALKPQ